MKILLTLNLLLFFVINIYSQKIDAPVISEWKTPKKLAPEYRYNSASIYLVNGILLSDLFSGATLTKDERKKYKLKVNDYAKYIYLSVEIPHPKTKELLTIPLYLLDAMNKSNQLFSAPNMGRILDEIKDEELNYKPLDAIGRIKAIKGNSAAEITSQAFEISTSLFKTALALKEGPFGANEILQNVQKGADYFNKIAQDKTITNEFKIPIIKESDIYKYEIYSVSVHQIKWDFRSKCEDLLNDISSKEQTLDQILGKLNSLNPYLVVVRYKSYYSLPSDYIKNVELEQVYLNNRQAKLVEFSGMKKEIEATLIDNLKEAISIKKDFAVYIRDKEVNQINYDVITRIINSYYQIIENYNYEIEKHKSNNERKLYFESNYIEAYRILFNKLSDFFTDELINAKNTVDKYFEINSKDLSTVSEQDLYTYLQQMEYIRNIVQKQQNDNKSITQITGSRFFPKYNELILKIENVLYQKSFNTDKIASNDDKVSFLNNQMNNYPLCLECTKKANLFVTKINKDNDNARKDQLIKMQKEYLMTLKCWEEIARVTIDSLNHKYPKNELENLTIINKKIYQEIEKQYQNILSASNDYLPIVDVKSDNLSSNDLIEQLNKYLLIRKNVSQSLSILSTYKLISNSIITCSND